jgi:hypothetical protein
VTLEEHPVFAEAADSVAMGGLLGWEAFTEAALAARPGLCAQWCLGRGSPPVRCRPAST